MTNIHDLPIDDLKSIKLDPNAPFEYFYAQYRIGEKYQLEEKDFETALKYYEKINNAPYPTVYYLAQWRMAQISFFFKKLDTTKEHYSNIKYTHGFKFLFYEAQIYLSILKNTKDNHIIFAENDIIKNKKLSLPNEINLNICVDMLNKIQNISSSTVSLLKVKHENNYENIVSHYTSPEVLFLLLNNNKIRLNAVDFTNDKKEQILLMDWMNISDNSLVKNIKSFITSFSFRRNSLNQFRLYGHEDDVVGTGVEIAFNNKFFDNCNNNDDIEFKLLTNLIRTDINDNLLDYIYSPKLDNLFPLSLYRCIYFEPDSQYLAIAKRNKYSFYNEFKHLTPKNIDKKWNDYINDIDEANKIKTIRKNLLEIKSLIQKGRTELIKWNYKPLLDTFNNMVSLIVIKLASLVKHASFEDENECRILSIKSISDKTIHWPEEFSEYNKLYLEYEEISNYIDAIYLAPKSKKHHKIWIENHISNNNLNIKVIQSNDPFQ